MTIEIRPNASAEVPGTEGYVDDAELLIPRYESVNPSEKYRAVTHLFPKVPSLVLDVGAGTGVDAAWFAQAGHQVLAVEPVSAFREAGIRLHPSPQIEWLEDSLPRLSGVVHRKKLFDVVLVSSVWNHLARDERGVAIAALGTLLAPGGVLIISLRHGPSPSNRRVFEVPIDETVNLASNHQLMLIASAETASVQLLNKQAGVNWSWLAFKN
ncbi:bifunctional 2-polyprenyl-6-hydroxyphenol methylase/3-demethylubiquinol 3-O-methyltransferase UbiG [Massilia sp. BSC265]|uniref:class I SAM-dependent methyltransferase n=1 Tax=Massilia sp. BSC265 TaxID=1549812 RepID=UPI0009DD0B41|nr:class I SAM-dependent methyltransferase [Massilia sp. BSC265]